MAVETGSSYLKTILEATNETGSSILEDCLSTQARQMSSAAAKLKSSTMLKEKGTPAVHAPERCSGYRNGLLG